MTEFDTRADGYLEDIRKAFATIDDSNDDAKADEARMNITYMALSVQTRGPWTLVGDTPVAGDGEYEVLLGTGGPACRVYGELSGYGEPETAELQWQDWGTPWERLRLSEQDQELILRFAREFYYGG